MAVQYCPYCDIEMNDDPKSVARKTRDHVIPRAMGGKTIISACWRCNHDKAALTPAEWYQMLSRDKDARIVHVARFLAERMADIDEREGTDVETDDRVSVIAGSIAMFMWETDDITRLTLRQWAQARKLARKCIYNLHINGFLKEVQ